MKRIFLIAAILFLPAIQGFALSSGDQAQFEKANIAYRENKFDEAAALYHVLASKHPQNAVFQYNFGNALHRKGELGQAILAFERARIAAPRNPDVLNNLSYVRGLLEYRVEDKRNEFIKLTEKFLGYFTLEELLLAAAGAWFLFFGIWAAAVFVKQDPSWGILRKFLLMIALFSALTLILKSVQVNFFREAIVVTKEAQVYFGPSVNDQPAFRLGEGLKVFEVDDREGWSRILIASGESGWIQKELISEVQAGA